MPYATGTFTRFQIMTNDLDYVDLKPLSASTMKNVTFGMRLYDNNMTAAEVNHTLVDLDTITAANPSGWSGGTIDISGSNAAPDGSSGGYDGNTAVTNLIASGWTVTTS